MEFQGPGSRSAVNVVNVLATLWHTQVQLFSPLPSLLPFFLPSLLLPLLSPSLPFLPPPPSLSLLLPKTHAQEK